MTVISLKDVHKKYPLGKTEVHAVKGVSFDIESGDFISIAGPSGSGKSTILNMIGCIDTASEGIVTINNINTSEHIPNNTVIAPDQDNFLLKLNAWRFPRK